MKKLFPVISLMLLVTQLCFGQIYSTSDFTETPFPKYMSKEWLELNHASIMFSVKIVNGELEIGKASHRNEQKDFKLPYGMLVTQNFGEFGGGLYYKANDTTKKVYFVNDKADTIKNKILANKGHIAQIPLDWTQRNVLRIKGGNVDTVFSYHNNLYYMEGLAHMGSNYGNIGQLKINKDSISFKNVISFDNAPRLVSVFNDKLYIVSFSRLYIINNFSIELVINNGVWEGIGIGSISIKNQDEIYIGMKGGYIKVKPSTQQMTFFKYNKL